jgi:hypothetical protein
MQLMFVEGENPILANERLMKVHYEARVVVKTDQ